jgi:hypothetical protein
VIQQSSGRFKINRITALDPAREFFHVPPILGVPLTYADATFVDAIHTDGLNRGTPYRIGHVDFFPDGGLFQSSCPPVSFNVITSELKMMITDKKINFLSFSGFCSHWKAIFYYANSLKNKRAYPSRSCDTFAHFKEGLCDCNQINHMGYAASQLAQGVFYLSISKNDTLTASDYLTAFKNILKAAFTRSDVNMIINKKLEYFGKKFN